MNSRYNALGFVAVGVILYMVLASPRGGTPADSSSMPVARDGASN